MVQIIRRIRIPPLSVVAGFSLVAPAVIIIIGWFAHISALRELISHLGSLTLPASVAFCLSGIAILVTRPMAESHASKISGPDSAKSASPSDCAPPRRDAYRIGTYLTGVLLGLTLLSILHWAGMGGIDLWVDQVWHSWISDTGIHLAPMQPAAAAGFVIIALILALLNNVHTTAMVRLALLLTLTLLFSGVVEIGGRLLGLDEILSEYPGATLADGIGFVFCSVGLLSIEYRDCRFQRHWRQDESRRLNLVGGTLLVMMGLIGVLGGFALLVPLTVSELQNELQLGLGNRGDLVKSSIDQGWQASTTFAKESLRLQAVQGMVIRPDDADQLANLQKVADSARSFGFSAIVLRDLTGRDLARAGAFARDPEISAALNLPSPSKLIWKNEFILHARIDLTISGHVVGSMEVERPLPSIDKVLQDTAYIGKTTDFAVCASAGEAMNCFPFRSTGGKVLRNLPATFNGQPIPMSYALAGKTGVIHTSDYRGQRVIAAYAPLSKTGLGSVLKIDATEFYKPIAKTLGRLLALLALLLVIGILVLRLQILPLVRKMVREIHERKQAEEKISYLASHDTLTDLPNRLLVHDRFDQAIARASRNGSKAALLFIDLDNFKEVNDSLGHSVGDAVLKLVAKRLHDCLRNTDTISRQGGDEFLVVLSDVVDYADIAGVMDKMMERQLAPIHIEDYELYSTLSVGITVYPDDGNDFETLFKKADTAMYHAKDAGRNTYRFFTEQMNIDAVERLNMRQLLKKALDRKEFTIHYQPLIDLATGRVVGAEALLRWYSPERGHMSPAHFVPSAEESGLIVAIGDWVLREACRQAAAWRRAGLPDLIIAVNLSAVQFRRGDVEKSVATALMESGLDPACLELELTESILIQDSENILATIQRLRLLGVTLSIDDFGTGYSSLSYLKRFDVNRVKIDKSFIHDMADDQGHAAIVYAIIQMAKALNLKTVAEGVEEERMLTLLRQYRCDWVQGYHFARPMPADGFARYFTTAAGGSNVPGPDLSLDTHNQAKIK